MERGPLPPFYSWQCVQMFNDDIPVYFLLLCKNLSSYLGRSLFVKYSDPVEVIKEHSRSFQRLVSHPYQSIILRAKSYNISIIIEFEGYNRFLNRYLLI